MCGGNAGRRRPRASPSGLSPRVRGKQPREPREGDAVRSIPACAGETPVHPQQPTFLGVYPRVCGGNAARRWSPPPIGGLSPRVRGKPRRYHQLQRRRGSIPACAGETGGVGEKGSGSGVYPRVCGGNGDGRLSTGDGRGLSPRVRGKPSLKTNLAGLPGSIPACAGETGRRPGPCPATAVYPRVCGLSPRVRGKPP